MVPHFMQSQSQSPYNGLQGPTQSGFLIIPLISPFTTAVLALIHFLLHRTCIPRVWPSTLLSQDFSVCSFLCLECSVWLVPSSFRSGPPQHLLRETIPDYMIKITIFHTLDFFFQSIYYSLVLCCTFLNLKCHHWSFMAYHKRNHQMKYKLPSLKMHIMWTPWEQSFWCIWSLSRRRPGP